MSRYYFLNVILKFVIFQIDSKTFKVLNLHQIYCQDWIYFFAHIDVESFLVVRKSRVPRAKCCFNVRRRHRRWANVKATLGDREVVARR